MKFESLGVKKILNLSSEIFDSNLTYFNFPFRSSPAKFRSLKEIHLAVSSRNEFKLKSEMMNKLLRKIFSSACLELPTIPRFDLNCALLKQFRVYFCPTLNSNQIEKNIFEGFFFHRFYFRLKFLLETISEWRRGGFWYSNYFWNKTSKRLRCDFDWLAIEFLMEIWIDFWVKIEQKVQLISDSQRRVNWV